MNLNTYLGRLGRRLNFASEPVAARGIDRSVSVLGQKLKTYFSDNLKVQFPFGSYVRKTMLSHAADPERDVDVMVVFADRGLEPASYLRRLRAFVSDIYPRSGCNQDHPTVRLVLGHIRFELVPGLWQGPRHYMIPDRPSAYRDWVSTRPQEFAERLEDAAAVRPQLRTAIRLAKYWNIAVDRPFESFELERRFVEVPPPQWPSDTRDLYARTLFAAITRIEPPRNASERQRQAVRRAQDIVRDACLLEFVGRSADAVQTIQTLLPPIGPHLGQQP